MNYLKNFISNCLVLCFIFFPILGLAVKVSADEIHWTEVANINNERQFIDRNSLKYNRGLLLVDVKYNKINLDNQEIIDTDKYLMIIDCEQRLFAKLPFNGDLKKIKTLVHPTDKRIIKQTILKSCSY